MKIRTDFVTNSSSSSFIVAYRSLPIIDDETIARYPFLKGYGRMIEKALFTATGNGTTRGEVITTQEEYDEYFVRRYGWRGRDTIQAIIEADPYLQELYDKVSEYLAKGFKILDKSVDYDDEYCAKMIRSLDDGENFIIIDDDD